MHEHRNTTLDIMRTMTIILFSFGIATLLHEFGHLLTAWSLGFHASIHTLEYATGSVIVYGSPTAFETVLIASSGSAILIVSGLMLIISKATLAGLVFVTRSWIDMIPVDGKDGSIIAESSSVAVAIGLLLIEIMICSVILFYTRKSFFYSIPNLVDVSPAIVFHRH